MGTARFVFGFLIAILLMFDSTSPLANPQAQSSSDVAALIENLHAKDWQVRWYAASSLGEMKVKEAVEPLIEVLRQDPNGYVRAMAAWALGQIGDRRAIVPLIDALSDKSHDVRKRAPIALKQITGKDFGKDQARWRRWWLSK